MDNQNTGQGNPFMDIVNKKQDAGQGMGMGGMMLNPAEASKAAPTTDANGAPIQQPDITQPGQADTGTKPLVAAISALQQFVTVGSDPKEITLIKQVIQLISNILSRQQLSALQQVKGAQGQ